MAIRFPTRKLNEMTRVELLEEAKRLRTENYQLKQKLQRDQHAGRRVNQLLEAIQSRCAQHHLEMTRLQRLEFLLDIARFLILFISFLLFIYATLLAVAEYGASGLGISNEYISSDYKWLIDDKIGSVFVGVLGLSIAIPSQITFPAPYRSFAAASLFAIKQIIIPFLPKWCIGIVGLFAIAAILTLNFDRKKQVSIFKINFKIIYPENETSQDIYYCTVSHTYLP
jgi:hypothetical protein